MLKLKKIAAIVIACTSSLAFSGTMGPVCTPGSVTVPCAHSGWGVGAQALYLQPRYAGMDYYGNIGNATVTGTDSQLNYIPVNDQWNWGFKIEGSYRFYTGNDLNINWYHFSNTSNQTINIPVGSSFADNIQNDYSGTAIAASRKPTWDAVNIEFGQHIDFSDRSSMRFHGGFQYARINTQVNLSSPSSVGTTTATAEAITYNGFGPRIGLDMSYNWEHGFAMYANGATALLIGPNQFKNTGVGSGVNTWTSLMGSTTAIVPVLEAKVGGKYTYAMDKGDLILDVGWMWNTYFNSQQNSTGYGGTSATAGSPAQGGLQQANFGLQGLYFGLNWVGNLA